jgi:tetratricopeptide (TPR) repeat protein
MDALESEARKVNSFTTERRNLLALLCLTLTLSGQSANYAADQGEGELKALVPKAALVPPESTLPQPSRKLEGRAEVNQQHDPNALMKAGTFYRQGVSALNSENIRLAADSFKRAGDLLEAIEGQEQFLGEARYAEAQSRRLLGQADAAAHLYQAAIDTFQQYDPLNPYLKGALDSLKKLKPALKGKVDRDEARLKALANPTQIMIVDRDVKLKGRISDTGARLSAEKATSDVESGYVRNTVHQAFLKMTCLETAELGSNYNTAQAKWMPLLANGHTASLTTSSDLNTPSISIKLNGRLYSVLVELPEMSANRRTVFLLTDGSKVIAIDPSTEDVWLMCAKFGNVKGPDFSWKKLNHHKDKRPKL